MKKHYSPQKKAERKNNDKGSSISFQLLCLLSKVYI